MRGIVIPSSLNYLFWPCSCSLKSGGAVRHPWLKRVLDQAPVESRTWCASFSMTLSVAIVSLNEEANLGRTLQSVKWADEIVVVDSGSTDRTCEIARQYGAKVVGEPWRGYAAQKNFAIEHCTQSWVLSLDSDEEISAGLAEEMREAISDPNALDGYRMPRLTRFMARGA